MIAEKIYSFVEENYGLKAANSLQKLAESGSNRSYYRFWDEHDSKILTYSSDVVENETFFYFTQLLDQVHPEITPTIYQINTEKDLYIQEDLGTTSLMDLVKENSPHVDDLYRKVITKLIECQLGLHQLIDYDRCYSYQKFDQVLALRDLFQFKFYFLDALSIPFVPNALLHDFKEFSLDFEKLEPKGFVFRDFQSRNIMIYQNSPSFIDYQGGLEGPMLYDLVSLIWQAKANFPDHKKTDFLHEYLQQLKIYLPDYTNEMLYDTYHYCVVIRILQTLGTYGLRGLIERKPHFLDSILFGIENLKKIIDFPLLQKYPALLSIIHQLILPETIHQIKQKIHGHTAQH